VASFFNSGLELVRLSLNKPGLSAAGMRKRE